MKILILKKELELMESNRELFLEMREQEETNKKENYEYLSN